MIMVEPMKVELPASAWVFPPPVAWWRLQPSGWSAVVLAQIHGHPQGEPKLVTVVDPHVVLVVVVVRKQFLQGLANVRA